MSDVPAALERGSFGRMLGLGAGAALLPTVAVGPDNAGATRVRCRTDPLFQVGTTVIGVTIGSQLEMYATATGPVRITLTTPEGMAVQRLVSDTGFGQGYEVVYTTNATLEGGMIGPSVRVEVMALSAADLPVSVSFARIGALGQVELRSTETQGRSNQTVTAR